VKTVRIIAVMLMTAGCASANVATVRDPAYAHRAFDNVAVFAAGMLLDSPRSIETQVCDKLPPMRCVVGSKLLLPGESYSPDEVGRLLARANVDGVVVIMLGDDQVASAFLANIVADSASSSPAQARTGRFYLNLAMWNAALPPMTTEAAHRFPIYDYQRAAHAIVGLFDRTSGRTAWGGQLMVSAEGTASVSDRDFIHAATAELAAELMKNRLVRPVAESPKGW
jgi:hypothetical protein